MSDIERVQLFSKLNAPCHAALVEAANTSCAQRGNPYVELLHWIEMLVRRPGSDFDLALARFNVDRAKLGRDLTSALDRLPRGASSISDFSPHIDETVERAWIYASVSHRVAKVQGGHLLLGILRTRSLKSVLLDMSDEFRKISADTFVAEFGEILASSTESKEARAQSVPSEGADPGREGDSALAKFSVDLTQRARNGEIDQVLGRDREIRQIIDVLMRRRQNNPILTGEAGVGKTAVVEGFAARVARGDVPPALQDVIVRTLDLGLLQAGASVKGEFENRLRKVIEEVGASPKPVILFVDEAHTLIGAGGAAGQGDAANLLKPALARGTLRTIAATTWAEYKKYFEKDPALTRRFQVIKVEEPTEAEAIPMMRGLGDALEKHHKVRIRDEAYRAAVRLSCRYIPSRQLPDKAVSLLDTACARVAITHHATPARVENIQRGIELLELELRVIEREALSGSDVGERRTSLSAELEQGRREKELVEAGWAREKQFLQAILGKRAELESTALIGEAREAALAEFRQLQGDLKSAQGDSPLVLPEVDEDAVAAVVADWTGIPVGRMVKNEVLAVLSLAPRLEERVVGQRYGLDTIARRIQTARAGLDNPSKPVGVFLLAGPSGVGKTETALALAENLYGGEDNLITINMSEFQEAHTVSTLKGAPPGYVGYGEGGILTEAVRRRPHSVILLDEVEKAHPDVHEFFFQVFDKGSMEDGEGRAIDFRNTVIILTTNIGSELMFKLFRDPELAPAPESVVPELRKELLAATDHGKKLFPPALLGRMNIVPYLPLSDDMLRRIIDLQLRRIQVRMAANRGIALSYDADVLQLVHQRCAEGESGARMVDSILTQTLLPDLSRHLLDRMLAGAGTDHVKVGVAGGEFVYQIN